MQSGKVRFHESSKGHRRKGARRGITVTVRKSKLQIKAERLVKKASRLALYVFAAAGFVGLAWLVLQ